MEIKICGEITAKDVKEVPGFLKKAGKFTKWVEIRADHILNLTNEDISKLSQLCRDFNTIFTLRDVKFGGKFNKRDEKRIELFKFALTQNFLYYDVDLEVFSEFEKEIKSSKKNIILSFHDFEKTLTPEELEKLFIRMAGLKPGIVKIAMMVKGEDDLKNLASVLVRFPDVKKIIIGMGKDGVISRIVFPLLGSFLVYSSIGNKPAAPGQLSLSQLTRIYSNINKSISKF